MTNDCRNCFYGSFTYEDEPCCNCTAYNKWIAKDTFSVLEKPYYEIFKERTVGLGRTEGVKYDNDKPQWSLVPFKAFTEVVDVLTYGAKKYAPDNWKKVPDARRRYIDAGFRHFTAYASGEKLDPETGKSHLAHAMCCMLFLLAFDKGEDRDQGDNDN